MKIESPSSALLDLGLQRRNFCLLGFYCCLCTIVRLLVKVKVKVLLQSVHQSFRSTKWQTSGLMPNCADLWLFVMIIYVSTSREQRNIVQRCARCELHLLFFLEFDFVQVSSWKLPRWEEILCPSETVPKCKNFFPSVKQIHETLHCIASSLDKKKLFDIQKCI